MAVRFVSRILEPFVVVDEVTCHSVSETQPQVTIQRFAQDEASSLSIKESSIHVFWLDLHVYTHGCCQAAAACSDINMIHTVHTDKSMTVSLRIMV